MDLSRQIYISICKIGITLQYQVYDMSDSNSAVQLPKYQQILESLKNDILCGRYQAGQKLPSEAALVRRFGTSRITVGRSLRELRQTGLIQSHAVASPLLLILTLHRP
jgi:DNA-binding GntR family transcriptional regulator